MTTAQRVVRSVLAPLTRTRAFRRYAPVVLPPIEDALARLTGSRVQLSALLVPSLILHTRGVRSGLIRSVPLMYTPDGKGRAIVAGTSFARPDHPAWTANLLSHPTASITVRGRRMTVEASLIENGDRELAWQRIEAQWPGYREYERSSGRRVRLFLLQPVRDYADASATESEKTVAVPATTASTRADSRP